MDSNDEKANNSGSGEDQSDAKTWFNFGNRPNNERSSDGVLNIAEDAIEYDMQHKNSGKCIILNHEYFKDNKLSQRKGSTADANALFQCFQRLGFNVIMKNDLSCDKLFTFLSEVAKEDHSDNDCFVCCILTHGQNDGLWANDQMYSLDRILNLFTGDKCKSLAAKPKIFFIQACRGVEFDDGVQIKVPKDVTDGKDSKLVKIPVFADYLIAYSTMSGYYAWRNQSEGSWFVNHLTDTINKHHKEHDLLSMLTIANQRIAYTNASKCEGFNDKKQIPCITHTLTRKILFSDRKRRQSFQIQYSTQL